MRRVTTRPGLPYFVLDDGVSWTPIGHNDALPWPELNGLFRRRDMAGVDRHLAWLADHGVTCLRIMLEYCHREHRYLEKPAGRFVPAMVTLWDDLFALLEKHGLRVLLTPYDTFFMWIRWRDHPYNRANGGACADRRTWLTCPDMRDAIKARLAFASDRWGASPALFAWDIWNEIHPAHGHDDPATAAAFVDDVAPWLRAREIATHGRANLQTVSVFGPELIRHPVLNETIFRHPALDFANTHLYEHGTIDAPRDTVTPALAAGRLIRAAVAEARDMRPVFDSEHGPIHSFKDRKKTLSQAFDDEYFRHIQWAHLAAGGAGGGMRWPNRHPHVLTAGMRAAQRVLADFLPLIDWSRFARRVLDDARCDDPGVAVLACGDAAQAVAWLVRTDALDRDGRIAEAVSTAPTTLHLPGLRAGPCRVTVIETRGCVILWQGIVEADDGIAIPLPGIVRDGAVAVQALP